MSGFEHSALDFNGSNNYFVELPYRKDLDMDAGHITLEAWIKTTSGSYQRAISKAFNSNTTTGECYEIGVNNNGNMRFACPPMFDLNAGKVNDGQWHHIVGTYDGNEVNMYVDGVNVLTQVKPGNIRKSNEPVYIGVQNYGKPNYGISGPVDEARIWNRVLTEEEILSKMNVSLLKPHNEHGLVAYFKFDEGSGNLTKEEITGAMLSINGATWIKSDVPVSLQTFGKVLFKTSDGLIKSFDEEGNLIDVPELTEETIEEFGIEDLSFLDRKEVDIDGSIVEYSPLDELGDNFKVIRWFEKEDTAAELTILQIPNDQLVVPTKDINISSVGNIDWFEIKVNETGTGVVKIVVSFDEGESWYAYTGGKWNEVELTVEDVKQKGMVVNSFNTVHSNDWEDLRNESKTVRFAYLLSVDEYLDEAAVDELMSQVDMKGLWMKAIHGTDYNYGYSDNDSLVVNIYQSGDYKINY